LDPVIDNFPDEQGEENIPIVENTTEIVENTTEVVENTPEIKSEERVPVRNETDYSFRREQKPYTSESEIKIKFADERRPDRTYDFDGIISNSGF